MREIQVRIRPITLPDGPRGTMARLRNSGGFALLESALAMPNQAQWSYVAGPALAVLYTDDASTRLERDGRELAVWADPLDALCEVAAGDASEVSLDGECPDGMNFIGGWVGVLGYDLARQSKQPQARHDDGSELPLQWWMAVDQVFAFHHPSGRWWHATSNGQVLRPPWNTDGRSTVWRGSLLAARGALPQKSAWHAGPLRKRTSRAEFELGVSSIKEDIARGDVLQVNLTRREDASFSGDPWALYEDLAEANSAPFSAYFEGPGFAIASCSPERFLHRKADRIEARPIKGTASRGADEISDMAQRRSLAASVKDRAENLMIVDLMRNDFGRVAVTGSVDVPELFVLEPYASVWQMVSTIRARLRADCDMASLLRACWPPGSMTGAPKIKAMQIIDAMEPSRRGWYSGALGYLDCRGNMDLSVVIRTAIVDSGRVTVQFGGGIVADSDPAAEWRETVAKGLRMIEVLERGCRRDRATS